MAEGRRGLPEKQVCSTIVLAPVGAGGLNTGEVMNDNTLLLKNAAKQLADTKAALADQLERKVKSVLGEDAVQYVHIDLREEKIDFQIYGTL
jgi:hypothetical protein